MSKAALNQLLVTGIHAARPVATDVGVAALYSCTTHSLIYQSNGAVWSTWASLGGGGGEVVIPVTPPSGYVSTDVESLLLETIAQLTAAVGYLADSWINAAGLTTSRGRTLTNVARVATGGPTNNPYFYGTVQDGNWQTFLTITGLAESDRVRLVCDAKTTTGGGTGLRVDGATSPLVGGAALPGSWTQFTTDVTLSSTGTWRLQGTYGPGVANMSVYLLGRL